ncbi:MAG: hypothetical protein OEY23_05695 [Acidimicrobiia bacterium]|nr:hypothetical protein [Acidimicrobiia bacterium]
MVKSASLVRTGLTEELIAKLDDYATSDLPAAWIAALKLTDHLAGDVGGLMDPRLYDELREHFDEQQILRLSALITLGSGWQRMIEALGIRPDHYEEGQLPPWFRDSDPAD